MIEYWHWHTLHFGTETYWGGVLPHSGQPGRTYAELARLGAEFETAGPLVAGLEPDADITMVYSTPSKWLMQKYPPLATADGSPDAASYHGIFDPFYRGAFDAGRQVRIVHARQLLRPAAAPRWRRRGRAAHPVLVVPGALPRRRRDDRLARRLRARRRPPGPRPADRLRRPRGQGPAGHRTRAAGRGRRRPVRRVQQPGRRRARARRAGWPAPAAGRPRRRPSGSTGWSCSTREVLVQYEHPHFGRWPAVTTRAHGDGRVTYVGTVPGRELAQALATWLAPAAVSGWRDLPASVTVTTGTSPDGRRVHVVHNWSWEPARVEAPVHLSDVLNGERRTGRRHDRARSLGRAGVHHRQQLRGQCRAAVDVVRHVRRRGGHDGG